jgi:hypothetical protein
MKKIEKAHEYPISSVDKVNEVIETENNIRKTRTEIIIEEVCNRLVKISKLWGHCERSTHRRWIHG